MQIEVIQRNPRFKVEMSADEFEFLYRLLGYHVVGDGKFRTISNGIFDTLDTCNKRYGLGVISDSLPNSGNAYIRLE